MPFRMTREKPMMELSGVRSSWLMLARNWLLRRSTSLHFFDGFLSQFVGAGVVDGDGDLVGQNLENGDVTGVESICLG